MTTSTYVVAVASDEVVCVGVATLLAVGFLLVLFFSWIQMTRLWAEGSKLSNRKRVFLRIMGCNFVRCMWYTMSSFNLLPESLGGEGMKVWADMLSIKLSVSTWQAVSHYFYLLPTALLFTATSWVVINWFHLYRKEKLRQKLEPWNTGAETTPQQRRAKAMHKMNKLYRFHVVANSVVHVAVVVLAPLSSYVTNSPVLAFMSAEAILAMLSGLALAAVMFYACRRLANLRLAKRGDSEKLKQHTLLLLVVTASLLCYYLFIISANFVGVFDPYHDPSGFALLSPGLTRTHSLLRIFELLHNTLLLAILALPSLSSRAPFPAKTSEITQDWLTSVLRENGTIRSTTTVIAFSYEPLYGGCHFKVARVHLKYSVEKEDDPHKTVIVKLLYWDKPLLQRVIIYAKYLFLPLDREAMYLNSYRIESHFYHRQELNLRGFHIAKTYYNQEDVFNNRFGMVLQDLSRHVDGQPSGFSLEDARRVLAALAEFHAVNFREPLQDISGWNCAGYWTGNKREANKTLVGRAWEGVMQNFPEKDLRNRWPALGVVFQHKLDYMQAEFDRLCSPRYSTLCHGDFKISNLFVKQPKPKSPDGKVYVIDWQWFGRGNPAIDAVYFLYTSLEEEALEQIPVLLEFYFSEFLSHLPTAKRTPEYTFKEFRHHADVVLVDFCVYSICSKWSVMTKTDFGHYAQKQKDGLHLRSIPHMEMILRDARTIARAWHLIRRRSA